MQALDVSALPAQIMPSEDVLFAAKASAYEMRYDGDASAFWHKRGTGKLQVLQNRETKLARLFGVDRKTREPMANFALMPQMKMVRQYLNLFLFSNANGLCKHRETVEPMREARSHLLSQVPCAQAESSRGAGNAFVAKIFDCSSGSPVEVHLALRIKAIPMVQEFLAAVATGQRENAIHDSALASLFPVETGAAAEPGAYPSAGQPEAQSMLHLRNYGEPSGDAAAEASSFDDGTTAAAFRPLQTSPRTSPRPGESSLDDGEDTDGSPRGQPVAMGVHGASRPHAMEEPSAAVITSEVVRPAVGRTTSPAVTFSDEAAQVAIAPAEGGDSVDKHEHPAPRPSPPRHGAASVAVGVVPTSMVATPQRLAQLEQRESGHDAAPADTAAAAASATATASPRYPGSSGRRHSPPHIPGRKTAPLAMGEPRHGAGLLGPPYTAEVVRSLQAAMGAGHMTPGGAALARRAAAAMALSDGDRVLDLGCGAGGSAVCLASEYGAAVTAVDESGACVEQARAAADAADASAGRALGIIVLHGAAQGAALAAGGFDAALLRGLLSHSSKPQALLKVAARAVRAGGVAVVLDRVAGPEAEAYAADCATYAARGIRLHAIPALRAWAEATGWRVQRVDTDSTSAEVTDSLRNCARLLHGRIKAAQALGDAAGSFPALRAELLAEAGRLEAGIVRYTMLTLERTPTAAAKSACEAAPCAGGSNLEEAGNKPESRTSDMGGVTVGGVVATAAALGMLALGGWFVINHTDLGSTITNASRRAVRAMFPTDEASE